MKNNQLLLLISVVFLSPGYAIALDGSINIGIGVEHTDNALQSDINKRSELEKRANARLQLQHEGDSVVANVGYSLEFTSYDKDTQEDQTSVTGDASIVYEQIQDQLIWTVENSRTSVIRDKQLADLQSNREDRSTSTISPMLILRASPVDTVNTSVSYTDIAYEDSEQQDSGRASMDVNWVHVLSKVDNFSAGLSYQDITFDIDDNDYEYYLATIGYEASLSKLQYSINVGYNQSRREVDDINGGYFSASATYQNAVSVWAVNILRELTDTSRQNNNDSLTSLGDSNNLDSGIDVFERSSVELTYNNEGLCGACTFSSSLLYEIEDYETLENDSDELALNIGFDYRFSRLTTLGADVSYSEFLFDGANTRGDYSVTDYGLSLSHDILKDLSMSIYLSYTERSSDLGLGEYEELVGGLSINYQVY